MRVFPTGAVGGLGFRAVNLDLNLAGFTHPAANDADATLESSRLGILQLLSGSTTRSAAVGTGSLNDKILQAFLSMESDLVTLLGKIIHDKLSGCAGEEFATKVRHSDLDLGKFLAVRQGTDGMGAILEQIPVEQETKTIVRIAAN